tara:strand:+ start:114 stop:326 length:213 start_codon:yes stop_codon:yes gene_type:complete
MTDLNDYESTIVEETAEDKAERYRNLGDTQLNGMYQDALKYQNLGKPWRESTIEALVKVCKENGVIRLKN